jgi:hypothetical protein
VTRKACGRVSLYKTTPSFFLAELPVNQRVLVAILTSLTATAGCYRGTTPHGDVETRVEVDRTHVTVGEALGLRAIATNHGDEAVEFIAGCGAGLDFEVQRPDGDRQFLMRGLPSICPIFDSNILEPGETDTVSYVWTVPQQTGTYRVWAGGRVREGLAARSAPVELRVN